MEFYGLDPETYHSEVINPDEPATMKKKKKNKSPLKGKSQCFVEEASENEADLEVPNKEHDCITGQEKVDNTLSHQFPINIWQPKRESRLCWSYLQTQYTPPQTCPQCTTSTVWIQLWSTSTLSWYLQLICLWFLMKLCISEFNYCFLISDQYSRKCEQIKQNIINL